MNRELEQLLKAYDAWRQAAGAEARRLEVIYQSLVDELFERHPKLSRTTLQQMIDAAYRRWCRAQDKPPSLPPRA